MRCCFLKIITVMTAQLLIATVGEHKMMSLGSILTRMRLIWLKLNIVDAMILKPTDTFELG